jgi:hypothetical protein
MKLIRLSAQLSAFAKTTAGEQPDGKGSKKSGRLVPNRPPSATDLLSSTGGRPPSTARRAAAVHFLRMMRTIHAERCRLRG